MSTSIEISKPRPEVEVLPSGPQCYAYLRSLDPHTREEWFAPSGSTIQEIVDHFVSKDTNHLITVTVNGYSIYRKNWSYVRPKDSAVVSVRLVPGDLITLVSLLVATIPGLGVVAPIVTSGLLALGIPGGLALGIGSIIISSAIIIGGVYFLGRLAISSLIGEPPELGDGVRGASSSPTANNLGNQELPFTPIWRNYGRNRLYPPRAAKPYTFTRDKKRYIRELFAIGGYNMIEDVRLGDTPITDFSTHTLEMREGWDSDTDLTLFEQDVSSIGIQFSFPSGSVDTYDEAVAAGRVPHINPLLDNGDGPVDSNPGYAFGVVDVTEYLYRTTQTECDEIRFEFNMPNGIQFIGEAGKRYTEAFILQIDYKLTTDEDIEDNWIRGGYQAKAFSEWNLGFFPPNIPLATNNPVGGGPGPLPTDRLPSPWDYIIVNSAWAEFGGGRFGISVNRFHHDNVSGFYFSGRSVEPFWNTFTLRTPAKAKYDLRIRRLDIIPYREIGFNSNRSRWNTWRRLTNSGGANITRISNATLTSITEVSYQPALPRNTDGTVYKAGPMTLVGIEVDAEDASGLGGRFNATYTSYLPSIVEGGVAAYMARFRSSTTPQGYTHPWESFGGQSDLNTLVPLSYAARLTIRGSDPQVAIPSTHTDDSINVPITSTNKYVRMRIKQVEAPTDGIWEGALFFTTDTQTSFNSTHKQTTAAPTYTGSEYTLLTWDMTGVSTYTGTLKRIRFDLYANGTTGVFDIESIQVDDGSGINVRPATATPIASNLSSNACDAYVDIAMRGEDKMVASDLNLEQLSGWRNRILRDSRETNAVFDYDVTKLDAFQVIAGAANGSFRLDGNKLSVSDEYAGKTAKGLFTPMDIRGFNLNRTMDEVPDAVRVRFRDETNGYETTERVVSRTGFSQNEGQDGLPTPVRIQDLKLSATTNPEQIYKDARLYLALLQARSETFMWTTGMQHIGIERGDKVLLQHPTMLVGLSTGRIDSVTTSSGNITHLVLSNEVRFEAGDYVIRVMCKNTAANTMETLLIPLTNPVTSAAPVITKTVQLATPISTGATVRPHAAEGEEELFAFGYSGSETVEAVIIKKTWKSDLSADLEAVLAADSVFANAVEGIYDYSHYVPRLSSDSGVPGSSFVIPAPTIDSIVSDESAAQVLFSTGNRRQIAIRMLVQTSLDSTYSSASSVKIQIRYRPVVPPGIGGDNLEAPLSFSRGPWVVKSADASEDRAIYADNVEQGFLYEVQARAVSADPATVGRTSLWSTMDVHKVTGLSNPPSDIQDLRIDNLEYLNWDQANQPVDVAGYKVKVGYGDAPTWDGAVEIDSGLVQPPYPVRNAGFGTTRTIYVKAVDIAGNESVNAASLTTDIGTATISNTNTQIRSVAQGPSWSGTLTGGTIDSGAIKATAEANESDGSVVMWPWEDGGQRAWSEDTSVNRWARTRYQEMAYEWAFSTSESDAPFRLKLDLSGITSSQYSIEYTQDVAFWSTDSASFWSGMDNKEFYDTFTSYQPWPGYVESEVSTDYTFKFVAPAGTTRAVVGNITNTVDGLPVEDSGSGFSVAASGTVRLTLNKTFKVIRSVSISVRNVVGESALSWKILDLNATNGPSVELYNSGGTRVAGTVDYYIIGY